MTRLYRGKRISQMLLDKQAADLRMNATDRSVWYVPNEGLLSEQAAELFHLSSFDQGTQQFLDQSFEASNSMCLQTWYALFSGFLSVFFSKTTSNGIMNRGGMFVFSPEQLRAFLKIPEEWNPQNKRVLDLGSGDGGVTAQFSQFFPEVYATEMSTVMQMRLRERGFTVLDVEEWARPTRKYDLISVLNLLDRHYNPRILLGQLHEVASVSECNVLLAIVLPVRQYVEFHPTGSTTKPDSWINVEGDTFEAHVNSIIEQEFEPAGFQVLRWTKLPYLCEGDFNKPFYLLSDAVFLLKPVPKPDPYRDAPTTSSTSHTEL